MLPARFPNLLVNGSGGIAVGMATNIPPHNLGEVIDATIAPDPATPRPRVDELMRFIPGPDFPTGGFIYGRDGIRQAYETGRGSIIMRARATVEVHPKTERESIVVTEIPYQVNKARLRRAASPSWCARSASRASPTCATRATARACASSSS